MASLHFYQLVATRQQLDQTCQYYQAATNQAC